MHLEQKNEAHVAEYVMEVTDMCSFLKQVGIQYASRCSLALMVEDKKRTDPYKAGHLEYSVTRRVIRFMGDRDGVQYNITEKKWELQSGANLRECTIWYSILRVVLNSPHMLDKYCELEFPVAVSPAPDVPAAHEVEALLNSSVQLFCNVSAIQKNIIQAIKSTLYWSPVEVNVASSRDRVFVKIVRKPFLIADNMEVEYEYSHEHGWMRSEGSPGVTGLRALLRKVYPHPLSGPAPAPPVPKLKHMVADLDASFKQDHILRDNIKAVLEGVLRKRVSVHRADGGIAVIVRQGVEEPNLKFTWTPRYGWKADRRAVQGPVFVICDLLDKIFPRLEEE